MTMAGASSAAAGCAMGQGTLWGGLTGRKQGVWGWPSLQAVCSLPQRVRPTHRRGSAGPTDLDRLCPQDTVPTRSNPTGGWGTYWAQGLVTNPTLKALQKGHHFQLPSCLCLQGG